MPAANSTSRRRFWLVTSLLLSTGGLVAGCSPQALNFLLMPFVDDKLPARCKLASPDKKEVTVAIVTTFTTLETRPEMLPVEAELSDRVAGEMRKRATENKQKINFVATSRVRSLMNQNASGTLSLHEIGQKLKADYVINLEINSISLYEKGSSNTLFRGKTEIGVTCIDASKPRGEGTIFQHIYTREYPGARGPIDAGNSSVLDFRTRFLEVIGKDVAHFFMDHPPERNLD